MKKIFITFGLVCATFVNGWAQLNPLDLEFHRLASRRFIFSNNIPLSEFVPAEIVAFESMHPAFLPSTKGMDEAECDKNFKPVINKGQLVLSNQCGQTPVSFYVGSVNPFATYEVDINQLTLKGDKGIKADSVEVGFELARLGLQDRVQLVAHRSTQKEGVYLRIYEDGKLVRQECYTDDLPDGPFKLRAQLYGHSWGAFIEEMDIRIISVMYL